ncbi:MAG: cytochrome c biogenesis protein CcdA [Deltaproteobacteria bacterium]|nr:cytochrome c biogenesis protein CcdA [Deltaproteobacteria bacterium]
MRWKFLGFLAFLFFSSGVLAQEKSPFRVLSADPVEIVPGQTTTIPLQIEIPPGYFIYKDKTEIEFLNLEGLKVKNIQYPHHEIYEDPFFKKKKEIFKGDAVVDVVLEVPASASSGERLLEALVKLQGCSATLCYPEEKHLVTFRVHVGGGVSDSREHNISTLSDPKQSSWKYLLHTQDFSKILEQGWWVVLIVVFLGGVLTSLTPCVLPLIPITLMIIGVRAQHPVRKNLLLSIYLVLGLAITYAGLGVLAVALGKSLGFVFQAKWVVISLAILFFALSLSMFGFYEIHLPKVLRHRLNHIKGHGRIGAFVSGAAAGLLAAPCAGPVVGSLLLFVAGNQNYLQGFILLWVYALGMGVLFVILGTGYGTLQGRFRRFPLSVWAKRAMGLVLFGISLFYLNTVVPLEKGLAWFGYQRSEQVIWIDSEPIGLELGRRENKIVLIDFYADWCAPCKELEIGFFRKPEVVSLLKQMVPVRIDATFSGNPEVERVLAKYKVVGWPTLLFVSPDGKVLKDLSVVSYNPELLLRNMRRAIE